MTSGWFNQVHETTVNVAPTGGARLSLALVIDTTGSMADDIDSVKLAASDIVRALVPHDVAVAVVDYRDFPQPPYGEVGDYPYRDVGPFSTAETDIINAIQALSLGSGNDWPESVYSALMHTINGSSLGGWTDGAAKFIIIMGDAPPHDPEPFTGYTLQSVIDAATGVSPPGLTTRSIGSAPSDRATETLQAQSADTIAIYSVVIGHDTEARDYFQALSEGTGGKLFTAASASQVPQAILEAIGDIIEPAFQIVSRQAPRFTGTSRVEGTLRQLTGQDLTLAGRVSVIGDLLVPGSPTVHVVGHPTFGGVVEGTGSSEPSDYAVTLVGSVRLDRLITRSDPLALPAPIPPPTPSGTRDLTITRAGTDLGDPTTLRNLTLLGEAGEVTVPPGTYGQFAAHGDNIFVLGIANATQPSIYNVQSLDLTGTSSLRLLGPIVINTANKVALTGQARLDTNPRWLRLNVTAGGVALTGTNILHGIIYAPLAPVTLTGGSTLLGGVIADRIILDGNSFIQNIPSVAGQ